VNQAHVFDRPRSILFLITLSLLLPGLTLGAEVPDLYAGREVRVIAWVNGDLPS